MIVMEFGLLGFLKVQMFVLLVNGLFVIKGVFLCEEEYFYSVMVFEEIIVNKIFFIFLLLVNNWFNYEIKGRLDFIGFNGGLVICWEIM